jgi:thiamine biosynthesis lipoprotein
MKLFLILCLFAGVLPGYAQPLQVLGGRTQGTTWEVKYRHPVSLKTGIDSVLEAMDQCLSLYRNDSELSAFNSGISHRFRSPIFFEVLKKSEEIFRESDGLFDPTVLPLVEAYGFGASRKRTGADPDSLRQWVGFGYIAYDATSVRKKKEGVRLDFNGIAQGYTVDLVGQYLEKKGVADYLVEIGGEIRCRGEKQPGKPWSIGIENPKHPGRNLATAPLKNRAMTTAGNYRSRYVADGQVYTHIINPKTGLMEQSNLLSVTVLAPDAMTADGYDTAFMVMGLERTRAFLARHPELDAWLVYADETGHLKTEATDGLKAILSTETNPK